MSARIGLATVGLAGVSLLIGAIGIANVMFISVTERTREIGLRIAVGARRQEVLVQFLMEAAFLSAIGGVAGVATALGIGLLLTLVISGFSAVAPLWAIVAGLDGVTRRRHRRRLLASAEGRGPGIRSKRCGMNNTSWRLRAAKAVQKAGMMMGHTIKLAAIGAVAFMVLDGVWLGLLMKNFYRDQLAPIVRLADGGIAPNWPAAFVVYALLGTGIALFVIPRASTVPLAAAYGALFGLVVYGVYDFTNYSTLRQWPFVLTLADMAWGAVASAAGAAAVRIVAR